MPTRRGLLAALAAGLAGCGTRRRDAPTPDSPPPPMNYEPVTPSTPTPRESPLSVDQSFRWAAPHFDVANSARPPTAGPTGAPSVQWECWLTRDVDTAHALIDGRWLYVFGGGEFAAIDRREGWMARSETLPVRPRTAPTLTDRGFVAGMRTRAGDAGLGRLELHGDVGWRRRGGNLGLPPVVADGTVYHCEGEQLVARSLDSGTLTWRYSTPDGGRFVTIPAVADGTVYVQGAERLYAFDAAAGEPRWRRSTATDRSATTAVSVGGGRVFVGFDGTPTTVAYDAASGEPVWEADGDVPIGVNAVADDRLVAATASGRVVARSVADGTVDWNEPGAVGSAVVADETVYVRGAAGDAGQSGLVALSLSDGTRRWHRPVPAEGWLLVADGHCYLNYGSGVVQCLG